MIFKIYIASVLMCFAIELITAFAMKSRRKREHPELKEYKGGVAENVHSFLFTLIPIFNLILIYVCLFKYDEVYEKAIKRLSE